VGGQGHAEAALTPGSDPLPILQKAAWSPGSVWTVTENLARTAIRTQNVQTAAGHYNDYAIPAALSGFIACISHRVKEWNTEMRVFHVEKVGNYITQNFPAVCSPYEQVLQWTGAETGGRGVNSNKNVSSAIPVTLRVLQDAFPETICYETLSDN
jgi:hypothetical protein